MASRGRSRPRTRGSIVASAHRDFVAALRAAKAEAQSANPSSPSLSSPRGSSFRSSSGSSTTPKAKRTASSDMPSYLTLHARGNTGSKRAAMRARILQRRTSRVHLPVVGPGAVPQSSMYKGGKPRISIVTTGDLSAAAPGSSKGKRKPPPPLKRSSTESRLLPPTLEAVQEGGEGGFEEDAEADAPRERSHTLPASPPKRPPPPPTATQGGSTAAAAHSAWPEFSTLKELMDAAVEIVALGQDSLRCGAQLLGQGGGAAHWAEQEFHSRGQQARTASQDNPEGGGGEAAAFPHFWMGTLIGDEDGATLRGVSTAELLHNACLCGLLRPITAAPGPDQSNAGQHTSDALDAATHSAALAGNAAAQQQALAIVSREALVRLLACGLPVWMESQPNVPKQQPGTGASTSDGSADDTSSDSESSGDAGGASLQALRRPSMLGMQRNSLETLQEVASSTMAALNPRQGIALLHFARCHALSGLGESKAAIATLLETACTGNAGASMPEEHIDVVLQSTLWWYEGAAEEEVESHAAGDVVSPSSCLAAAKLFLSGITPPLATTVYKNRKAMEAAASKNAEMRLRQAADICGLLPHGSSTGGRDEAFETSPVAIPNSQDAADIAELLAGLLQRSALVEQFDAHSADGGEFLAPKLLPLPPSADCVLLPAALQSLLAVKQRELASPGTFLSRASQHHHDCMAQVHAMLNAAVRLGSAAAAFGLTIVYGEALSPQADALLSSEGGAAVAEKVQLFLKLSGGV